MTGPKEIKDDFGKVIKEGDVISFSYGIPPVGVRADIVNENGKLIVIVPEPHKPNRCSLRSLKKMYNIYKEN